jgi:hypothetical protein
VQPAPFVDAGANVYCAQTPAPREDGYSVAFTLLPGVQQFDPNILAPGDWWCAVTTIAAFYDEYGLPELRESDYSNEVQRTVTDSAPLPNAPQLRRKLTLGACTPDPGGACKATLRTP